MITLVDVEGFRVASCERDIPEVDAIPEPWASWPLWTSLVQVRLGHRDFEHRIGATRFGDAYAGVISHADECPGEPDDEAIEAGCEPLPELPDERSPEEWPVDPPAGWKGGPEAGWASLDLGGKRPLPPLSGGSPEPLDGDRRDFEAWLSSLDADYPPQDQVPDWPRLSSLDDRRAFQADIARWYRDHPGD